jgi:hypothetical protein
MVDLIQFEASADDLRARVLREAAATSVTPSEASILRACRNLDPSGLQDLTALTDTELMTEAVQRAKICQALEATPARRQYNKFDHRIQIGHIRGPHLSLHLGSSRSSVHQPWVGTGFLTIAGNGQVIDSIRNGAARHKSIFRATSTIAHGLLADPTIDVLESDKLAGT